MDTKDLQLEDKTNLRVYHWIKWPGAIFLVAWPAITFILGPHVVREAYFERGYSYLARFMNKRDIYDVERYVQYWNSFVIQSTLVFGAVYAFGLWVFSRSDDHTTLPKANAADLGVIRFLCFGCLFVSSIWEDLPSSALLPDVMYHPVGILNWFHKIPGFGEFIHDHEALTYFNWLTRIALACGMVGLFTRVSLPVGILCYFILGATLRSYAWPYHTGLIPWWLGLLCCFLPVSDGFSLDALRKTRSWNGDRTTSAVYTWSRFACWVLLAAIFFLAGLSKVRNGGSEFLHPDNFRNILYSTTLTPMEFDFQLSTKLVEMPDVFFSGLALGGMLIQLSAIILPFSRRARMVLPVVFVAMHIGIWLLQNILFFEAMVLQLAFYQWWFTQWDSDGEVSDQTRNARLPRHGVVISRSISWAVAILFACIWLSRLEYFPITGMQMFSRPKLDSDLTYYKAIAKFDDGSTARAPFEEAIGATADSRYRHMLAKPFSNHRDPTAQFVKSVMKQWNAKYAEKRQKRIALVEIQQWKWEIHSPAVDGVFGELTGREVFDSQ